MKKPYVVCPACKEVYQKAATTDCVEGSEYVVICGIVYEQYENGQSNYKNYTIVPSHCERDKYTRCPVWRESIEEDWERKLGEKYSSLRQAETIRV
jgi:hypothetical protein